METRSIIWKRLDTPGHDACRLVRHGDGWQLAGAAVFRHDGQPCQVAYDVRCDEAWRTRSALVAGWIGASAFEFEVQRRGEAGWFLNGVEQPDAASCVDFD